MKLFAGVVLLVSAVHVAVVHTFATTGSSSSGLDILKDVVADAGLESLDICYPAILGTGKYGTSSWCSCCCGTCTGGCNGCMYDQYLANCECSPKNAGTPMDPPTWTIHTNKAVSGGNIAIYGVTNSAGGNWKTANKHHYTLGTSNTVMECKNLCAQYADCQGFTVFTKGDGSDGAIPFCRFKNGGTLTSVDSVYGMATYEKVVD